MTPKFQVFSQPFPNFHYTPGDIVNLQAALSAGMVTPEQAKKTKEDIVSGKQKPIPEPTVENVDVPKGALLVGLYITLSPQKTAKVFHPGNILNAGTWNDALMGTPHFGDPIIKVHAVQVDPASAGELLVSSDSSGDDDQSS